MHDGTKTKPKKVALLVGGWSAERDVSLEKGKAVHQGLLEAGYDVDVVDVTKDLQALIKALTPKPDAVFNNLYGRGGEDGEIQSILEVLEIPYTHSGVMASAVGMNKPLSKMIAASLGVPVAEEAVMNVDDVLKTNPMKPPYVVKPTNEGSSVGIRIIMEQENQPDLDLETWKSGTEVMVERYIPGRELTVAVLDGRAQGVTEIVSKTRFFDYEAKYQDDRTEYILPAKIDENVYKTCLDYAERVYNKLGCSGLARCDFRFDDTQTSNDPNTVYFLEINTQPGLTAESIGPSQVINNGMTFPQLCSHLVETAQCHDQDKPKQESHPLPEKEKAAKVQVA